MTTHIAQGPVDVNVMPLSVRIQWLESQRRASATRAEELRAQANRLEKDAAIAAQLLAEARNGACGDCRGFGRIRVQYAQDDIKSERCDRCGGTGERHNVELTGDGRLYRPASSDCKERR